jgi:cold shock CspA family protein
MKWQGTSFFSRTSKQERRGLRWNDVDTEEIDREEIEKEVSREKLERLKSNSKLAPTVDIRNHRLTGVIKSFSETTGYGFIESKAATEMYGSDVYLSISELMLRNIGDKVSFTLVETTKGRPKAKDLALVRAASNPLAPLNPTVPPSEAPRLHGMIKSYSELSHYGFIDCPELKATYGGDVFLANRNRGVFNVGDEITFRLLVDRGRPQAIDLLPVAELQPPRDLPALGPPRDLLATESAQALLRPQPQFLTMSDSRGQVAP